MFRKCSFPLKYHKKFKLHRFDKLSRKFFKVEKNAFPCRDKTISIAYSETWEAVSSLICQNVPNLANGSKMMSLAQRLE